jgi:hypothetical protein
MPVRLSDFVASPAPPKKPMRLSALRPTATPALVSLPELQRFSGSSRLDPPPGLRPTPYVPDLPFISLLQNYKWN